MNDLMIFEGHNIEVFELNGQVLFNPKHVAEILDIVDVKSSIRGFSEKQVVKVKNSDVHNMHFRKLNNAGENFLTESGVYKLVFKSHKPNAEKFTDWIADEVLPALRQTGHYEMQKQRTTKKVHSESLSAVNNAVKILTPMLAAAGCDSRIQLLTAKSLYEKADVTLPVMIEADQQYFDTVHIARKVGIYYQSSGKPADKAVNEIIRRLDIPENMYTETWESKGKWQGTVRKYAPEVITMVRSWYAEQGYPRDIEYVQSDGQMKAYHVIWRGSEVA
nr:MAG TPA: repressor domain protein [Caudoviricetes sp.]